MKTSFVASVLSVVLLGSLAGQTFTNLNFESAQVVSHDPIFGFLDWNLAAPGWSHSSGSDTQIIYSGQEHLGGTQYYMLYSSISPLYAPGTQLAGNYSLGFSSGAASSAQGAPWVQAYLSQIGLIAANVQSIRFLATGSFALFVGGFEIPVVSLGGNAYGGNIAGFAGMTTEVKIVNTALTIHTPVVVDNIAFSTLAVPEPSTVAMLLIGIAIPVFATRRRAKCS